MKQYIVTLKHKQKLEMFNNGEVFFDWASAKDYVEFAERVYPDNKGLYQIYEVTEVSE